MIYETQLLSPPVIFETTDLHVDQPELTFDERMSLVRLHDEGQLNDLTPDERVLMFASLRMLSPQVCVMALPDLEPVTLDQAMAYRQAGQLVTTPARERHVAPEVPFMGIPLLVPNRTMELV